MNNLHDGTLQDRRDQIAGGLVGLLVGDAVGVPYEFHPAEALPPTGQIDMVPPVAFPRAHANVPPGTWSDDGAQALCLLASLIEQRGLNLDDFGRRLVDWSDRGYLAVGGDVFDVGLQTSRALAALRAGAPPERSGPADEHANGNGSLMRVLPLALWHTADDAELIAMAARQSLPTHGHPRSQVACAMLCLWARQELSRANEAWGRAEEILMRLGVSAGLPYDEIEMVLSPSHRQRVRGSGYVVDALWSARVALEEASDYAASIRRAIAFGNDTDTTAAITGGIAGIRYGRSGIPIAWCEQLRGSRLLDPLLQNLLRCAVDQHDG